MKESILVIEDEEDILELIRYNLTKVGYRVAAAASGEAGVSLAASAKPDLILLDLMLPGMDGLDVCRAIKSNRDTQHIPVIMITARGEEADIVAGLELGADDYLTKPFSPRVLLARIKSVLRRGKVQTPEVGAIIRLEQLAINPARHEVTLDGELVDLTATEFKILHFLARQPGLVFTRYQIVDGVHGDDYPVTDRSIDVQVVGLRRKLSHYGNHIETVRGVGYRFKD